MKYIKKYEKIDRNRKVIYTLKTKAYSGKDYYYNVNIISDNDNSMVKKGYKYILSIENTPGSWYIKTLLEGNSMNSSVISIQGNEWFCYNWDEIMKELKEDVLPYLETYDDVEKYNL
jgi:hypothetical protein